MHVGVKFVSQTQGVKTQTEEPRHAETFVIVMAYDYAD